MPDWVNGVTAADAPYMRYIPRLHVELAGCVQVSIVNATLTCLKLPPKAQGQPKFAPSTKAIAIVVAVIPAAMLIGLVLVSPMRPGCLHSRQ